MADLGKVVEELRGSQARDSDHEEGRSLTHQKSAKRKRSRKRRNSGGSQGSADTTPSCQVPKERQEGNQSIRESIRQRADGQKQETFPADQEELQVRFYEDYRKVAEEYDKEFLKKYDEDLNTTLIFAGLFSAVTSAFIIEVDSQLQPDPGDETVALLRILIYKIDNTTFGNSIPALPQWTGPPNTMVHVQAILYASLVVTLLSAFLAMLGKQWLNRYASTDMRGSAIERSQNRQRKLDGIVRWYFDHVMESLPLMLQAALLLLGCALSRYLWEISIPVASVILAVTSFGLLFFLFIIVAGAASESCPYQTPGSHIIRHLAPKIWRVVRSAFSIVVSAPSAIGSALRNPIMASELIGTVGNHARYHYPWWSRSEIAPFLRELAPEIPFAFAVDLSRIGRAAIWALPALLIGVFRLARRVYTWLHDMCSSLERRLNEEAAAPGLRCVSWTLQTSLDKPIHLSTLKHLVMVAELANFDPTLATGCFNAFVGCVSISNHKVVVMQGLEQLAAVAVECLFRTLHQLLTTDPTSSILTDLRRHYNQVFPFDIDFRGLPFYNTMTRIHALAQEHWFPRMVYWGDYRPPINELISFSRHMVEAAQVEYQKTQHRKVPRWILRFAFHSLSLDPSSPASVVADCLMIIAVDLGCGLSNIATFDESARIERVSSLITQKLKTMVEAADPNLILSKRKNICALFPYATDLARSGNQGMAETILCAARTSNSNSWGIVGRSIAPYIVQAFHEPSPPSLDRVITLASPFAPWDEDELCTEHAVARWATAVSATPSSEEVSQSVVDVLLQIANISSLRPYIPTDLWVWLKERPSLPPVCEGRGNGSWDYTVRHVRGLGDIEILKSYFLLVWSEWDYAYDDPGFDEMRTSLREDFCGIGMGLHRKDLIDRLDCVLGQLNRGLEYLQQNPRSDEEFVRKAKERYVKFKEVLCELNGAAMNVLTQSHSTTVCALPLPCP